MDTGSRTTTTVHAKQGTHVCVACAAPRLAEARLRALHTGERAAAAEVRATAEAEVTAQTSPSGAARVRLRRAKTAEAEADMERVGGTEVAEALWRARCDLAVAPMQIKQAFPGVRCCDAAQALKERRHPLRPDTGGSLVGKIFEQDDRRWCVEELVALDDTGGVGLYAYETARYASATLRLEERCKLFGEEVLQALERGWHEQERARRQAEAFLGPSPAEWAAAVGDEEMESDTVTGRPTAATKPRHSVADVGRVDVGHVGVDEETPGWVPVYVGRLRH